MTSRLVQKDLFKGTQEFEIVDDAVKVRIKPRFREMSELTVVFSILNPEPVIEGGYLCFHSRVRCDPLLSLYRDKPNRVEFNAFVEEIRQRANACSLFLGPQAATAVQAPGDNTYDEPPEFADLSEPAKAVRNKRVNAERVGESLEMLQQYVGSAGIEPLIGALETLRAEPDNPANLEQMATAFNGLGLMQGAVLTYAPYVGVLLSDDPFGDP